MAKRGRRYQQAKSEIDTERVYSPLQAVRLIKSQELTKFDPTVELHIRLGVNVRHADQQLRGTISLPHGSGKSVTVAVFAQGEKAREAEEAGAPERDLDVDQVETGVERGAEEGGGLGGRTGESPALGARPERGEERPSRERPPERRQVGPLLERVEPQLDRGETRVEERRRRRERRVGRPAGRGDEERPFRRESQNETPSVVRGGLCGSRSPSRALGRLTSDERVALAVAMRDASARGPGRTSSGADSGGRPRALSTLPPPADPLRGVLEEDPAGGELVADRVGGGEVAALPGFLPGRDLRLDLGGGQEASTVLGGELVEDRVVSVAEEGLEGCPHLGPQGGLLGPCLTDLVGHLHLILVSLLGEKA